MLKLDLDSDQTVSLNWRRVASTHSFQELLIDDPTQPEYCKAATAFWGLALTACACTVLCGAVWCLLGFCKHTPLAADFKHIQLETYYMLLVPLTVPVTIAAVTCSWASLKLFKHNS